jgi:hypothetical protein
MTIRLAICYNGAVELRKNRPTDLWRALRGILSDWEDDTAPASIYGNVAPHACRFALRRPAMEEDRENGNRA